MIRLIQGKMVALTACFILLLGCGVITAGTEEDRGQAEEASSDDEKDQKEEKKEEGKKEKKEKKKKKDKK